jgi:hypothetical protein
MPVKRNKPLDLHKRVREHCHERYKMLYENGTSELKANFLKNIRKAIPFFDQLHENIRKEIITLNLFRRVSGLGSNKIMQGHEAIYKEKLKVIYSETVTKLMKGNNNKKDVIEILKKMHDEIRSISMESSARPINHQTRREPTRTIPISRPQPVMRAKPQKTVAPSIPKPMADLQTELAERKNQRRMRDEVVAEQQIRLKKDREAHQHQEEELRRQRSLDQQRIKAEELERLRREAEIQRQQKAGIRADELRKQELERQAQEQREQARRQTQERLAVEERQRKKRIEVEQERQRKLAEQRKREDQERQRKEFLRKRKERERVHTEQLERQKKEANPLREEGMSKLKETTDPAEQERIIKEYVDRISKNSKVLARGFQADARIKLKRWEKERQDQAEQRERNKPKLKEAKIDWYEDNSIIDGFYKDLIGGRSFGFEEFRKAFPVREYSLESVEKFLESLKSRFKEYIYEIQRSKIDKCFIEYKDTFIGKINSKKEAEDYINWLNKIAPGNIYLAKAKNSGNPIMNKLIEWQEKFVVDKFNDILNSTRKNKWQLGSKALNVFYNFVSIYYENISKALNDVISLNEKTRGRIKIGIDQRTYYDAKYVFQNSVSILEKFLELKEFLPSKFVEMKKKEIVDLDVQFDNATRKREYDRGTDIRDIQKAKEKALEVIIENSSELGEKIDEAREALEEIRRISPQLVH